MRAHKQRADNRRRDARACNVQRQRQPRFPVLRHPARHDAMAVFKLGAGVSIDIGRLSSQESLDVVGRHSASLLHIAMWYLESVATLALHCCASTCFSQQ